MQFQLSYKAMKWYIHNNKRVVYLSTIHFSALATNYVNLFSCRKLLNLRNWGYFIKNDDIQIKITNGSRQGVTQTK